MTLHTKYTCDACKQEVFSPNYITLTLKVTVPNLPVYIQQPAPQHLCQPCALRLNLVVPRDLQQKPPAPTIVDLLQEMIYESVAEALDN